MTSENTVTRVGREKMAQALADETAVDFHEIVLSSNTDLPSGLEEEVTNIVYKGLISEQGVVDGSPNQAFFRMIVPEDGEDGEDGEDENVNYGPWTAQQFGILDSDGVLIIVGRLAAQVNKTDPNIEPRGFGITINHIFSDINAVNLTYVATQNLPYASVQDHLEGLSASKIAHPQGVNAALQKAANQHPYFFFGLM